MTSYVTEDHWREYLGDNPMPEDATAEMLWAAQDALEEMEDRDNLLKRITFYENEWRKEIKLYRTAREERGIGTEYEQKYQKIETKLKSLKEIIELYRELLNG